MITATEVVPVTASRNMLRYASSGYWEKHPIERLRSAGRAGDEELAASESRPNVSRGKLAIAGAITQNYQHADGPRWRGVFLPASFTRILDCYLADARPALCAIVSNTGFNATSTV
jgi:hypothetical protein